MVTMPFEYRSAICFAAFVGIDMSGINIVLPDVGTNEVEQPLSRRLDRSQITSQPGILAGKGCFFVTLQIVVYILLTNSKALV